MGGALGRRAGIVLAAAACAWTSALAAPAPAQEVVPTLTVAPAQAHVGDTVTVTGTGHPAICGNSLSPYEIVAGGALLGTVSDVAVDGSFSLAATLPELDASLVTVVSRCDPFSLGPITVAQASVEVLPDEAVTPDAPSGPEAAAPSTPDRASGPGRTVTDPASSGVRGHLVTAPAPASDGAPATVPAPSAPRAPSTSAGAGDPEPASAPADDRGQERWSLSASVPGMTALHVTAAGISAAAALLSLFALLIGFPAYVFNATLRSHYDRIVAGLGPVGRVIERSRRLLVHIPSRVALAGATVGGAATAAALDGTLRADARSLTVMIALIAVVFLTSWLGWLPTKRLADRRGYPGRYRAYPLGLLVAGACLVVSRLADLEPGYLYGLLFAYVPVGEWSADDDGRTYGHGFLWVLVLSVAAWLARPLLGLAAPGSLAAVLVDAALGGLVIAGVHGVVFGMLPLAHTPGGAVWRWNRRVWLAIYVPGFLAFAALLSTPDRALLGAPAADVVRAAAGFGVFAVISLVVWDWFRRHPDVGAPAPAVVARPLVAAGGPGAPAEWAGAADEDAERELVGAGSR